MAQIQYIKHLYETEDKSLREISRITSHSFNTVKKYAYQDNWSPDNLPNIDPQNYPTLGPFIPIIDEWLDNDRRVPRKQRHTISRIFKRLCDEKGFTGSYSSVKFNEYLWSWCEKDAERIHYKHKVPIQELWEQEKDSLLVLPENPYSVFRYETVKPNKYGFVCIDTNSYGLRPSLNGCLVQAKIFYDSIEFYYNHSLEARYPRCYEHNKEILDWTKYIGALCKKPGAVADARFFNQLPKLWQAHLSNIGSRERKNALLLLKEIVSDGNAEMCDEALALARENGRTDTASLRQCYYMIAKRENRPLPIEVANVPELHYDPDLSAYDTLMGGVHNA